MKKRILSALLAFLMIFSVVALASCDASSSKKDDTADSGDETSVTARVPLTLTMWLPAAEGAEVDDESVAQVEKAINAITQAEYQTAIKLKVLPADEYDAAVSEKMYGIKAVAEAEEEAAAQKRKEQREAAAKGEEYVDTGSTVDNTLAVEEENEFAALNASVFTGYPKVENTQFDIFVMHGVKDYVSYYNDLMLCELEDFISDGNNVLYDYIHPNFFNHITTDGGIEIPICMIPNNHAAGAYQVMLINKEVADSLDYDAEKFTSVKTLFDYDTSGISFIEDVARNRPEVTPVCGTYSAPYVSYFNEDSDASEFSIVSSAVSADSVYADLEILNTFKNVNFVDYMTYSKRIREASAPVAWGSTDNFAVGFTTATGREIEEFSDKYQVVVIENPHPTADQIFESGFAVSKYTSDKTGERAMEIITLINTNSKLRTILQYGVEGTHWKQDVDDESVIQIISDKYKMDMIETGNAFITYPGDGQPMSDWDPDKKQNLASFYPITSSFKYQDAETTTPLLQELATLSADMWARVDAMSSAQFTENLSALRNEVDALNCVSRLLYVPKADGNDPAGTILDESLIFRWQEFCKEIAE